MTRRQSMHYWLMWAAGYEKLYLVTSWINNQPTPIIEMGAPIQ